MGNKNSKSSVEHEVAPKLDPTRVAEHSQMILSLNPDASIGISANLTYLKSLNEPSDQNKAPTSSSTRPHSRVTSSKRPRKKVKDLTTSYHECLENEVKFNHDKFSKCSADDISACLRILLKYFYINFKKIHMFQDYVYSIYESSRQTYRTNAAFSTGLQEIFQEEITKISSNLKWDEIVMFGAFLCQLLVDYQPGDFTITRQLNTWIMELIKSAVEGNENGLIAFMLILRRLSKKEGSLKESYDHLLGVLEILLRDGDTDRKTREIYNFLEQSRYAKFDDYEPPQVSKYKKEVANSKKCQEFENFLKNDDENAFFNVNLFTNIIENENEFFARKFIKAGIHKRQKIKFLAYTAHKLKRILTSIRKITINVVENLEEEIEVMKQNSDENLILITNFAKFIGEVYMNERSIIPTFMMTDWLSFLSESGEFITMTTTLKLCGWFYKQNEPEDFEQFIESIGIFGSVVNDEISKVSEKCDNKDSDIYLEYQKSRRFQPAEGARMIDDFGLFMSEISKDKNVDYNYKNLYDLKNYDLTMAANFFIREISKPTTNVIKLAEFLKSFYDTSFGIERFLKRLEHNFNFKISEFPLDNPNQIENIGKLIGELRNLAVIDKNPQIKWLEMIESLEPLKNSRILEIQLNVLKVMFHNFLVDDGKKYIQYLEYIKDIDPSDPKYSPQIKSKILQITQNAVLKKIDEAFKKILSRVKFGFKIDGLPQDIQETSPTEFDLNDFVKIFFINAITNRFFMENYIKSMRFLVNGPNGNTFSILLYGFSLNRFKTISRQEFFDEDEAIGTLTFILRLYPRSILKEKSLTPFLQNILKFEDFEINKSCLKILIQMIKKDGIFKEFMRQGHYGRNLFDLLRKAQVKLNEIENFNVENQEEEIEVWHIVDFQGTTNDESLLTKESIEPSQLAWSFTENYQLDQNIQKTSQNNTKCEENSDNFYQMDQNFNQPNPSLPQNTQKDDKNRKEDKFVTPDEWNLTRNDSKNRSDANSMENDWNVTRNDLKGRSDLQRIDLPKLSDRFDTRSPLYRVPGQMDQISATKYQNIQKSNQVHPAQKLDHSEPCLVNSPIKIKNSVQFGQNDDEEKGIRGRTSSIIKAKQIEWNVTRGDLKGRSDLQSDDSPKFCNPFNRSSALYQASSHLKTKPPPNDQATQNLAFSP